MKKYYTIEDLAIGKIAVKFKKDEGRLTEILKAAFPNDKYWGDYSNMSGVEVNERFYLDYDETKKEGVPSFWWSTNMEPKYDFPAVSEKYILLPGESVPEKLTWEKIIYEFTKEPIDVSLIDFLNKNFKCNVKRL
jgi:hypothetical protein